MCVDFRSLKETCNIRLGTEGSVCFFSRPVCLLIDKIKFTDNHEILDCRLPRGADVEIQGTKCCLFRKPSNDSNVCLSLINSMDNDAITLIVARQSEGV
jgi:hypothetical protein